MTPHQRGQPRQSQQSQQFRQLRQLRRPADEARDHDDNAVRPFVITGGRTQPVDDRLRIETLVRAEPAALSAPVHLERRRIIEVCQRPAAICDIAATLRIPLGVAMVLVADLAAERLVRVDRGAGEPSIETIERIRERVRGL
jgi:Protein of unknown function (DUF742)